MAEGGGLLNRYTVNTRIVGSNPIPSATSTKNYQQYQLIGYREFYSTHKLTPELRIDLAGR